MAAQMRITKTVVIGGKTLPSQKTVEGDLVLLRELTIAAAKAGSLSTRTDNDTGVLTLGSGHGIVDAQIVDVFWTVGGVNGHRRGMTVGTVSGTSVPIDGGSGDNLPAALSSITACVQQSEAFVLTGTDITGLVMHTTKGGCMALHSAGGEQLNKFLLANDNYAWYTDCGEANPITGDSITLLKATNKDSAASAVVKVAALIEDN